jgi:hypothetical protein
VNLDRRLSLSVCYQITLVVCVCLKPAELILLSQPRVPSFLFSGSLAELSLQEPGPGHQGAAFCAQPRVPLVHTFIAITYVPTNAVPYFIELTLECCQLRKSNYELLRIHPRSVGCGLHYETGAPI